jgi:hypothetical protein
MMFDEGASSSTVKSSVALRTRCPYRWTLASIEHSELEHCEIGRTTHDSAKCVDLSYYSALCNTANSRIARHLPDRLKGTRNESDLCTNAGGRNCGLSSGVTSTYYQDVEIRFG